jgi:uncharacterized protein (TIRG00374 family)
MDFQVKKKLLWATLLSAVFMALLLIKVDWGHFSSIVGRLDRIDFFIAFVIFVLANIVRSLRFHKLDHIGNKLSHWWIINQVYNFMTSTLPGGAGEAATAYLLKRFSAFNMMSAFRILILTRFMDLAGFSLFLFIAAIRIGKTTPYRETAVWISTIVFIISIILTHPKSELFLTRLLRKIPFQGRIIIKICERLEEITEISKNRFNGAYYGITMFQSMLIIAGSTLTVHFVLLSFGTGFTLIQSLYCFGVYAIFQMIPVQGVAGIGTQAAWWALALTIAGYDAPDAIAMGIVLHGTFYLLISSLGIPALLIWLMIRK